MKTAYMVFEESNETYKGGISSIIDSYFNSKEIFLSNGFSIERINPFCFGIPKNKLLRKIVNFFRPYFESRIIYKSLPKKDDNFIVHIHCGYGFVLYKNLYICKYLKKRKVKNIYLSIHFAGLDSIFSKNSLLRKIEIKRMKKYIDKIILLSKDTKKEFKNIGFKEDRLSVLYTFHNYNNEKCIFKKNNQNKIKLLFLGSIDKRKGVLDILEVFKNIDPLKYEINFCGSNNDNETFLKFTKEINTMPNVKFLGYVCGNDKIDILKKSNALILPSYGEGLPVAIIEAMHFGCCILASSVGAIPEIIENEKNGYLFKAGDLNKITNILLSLNKNDLERIALNNQEKALAFSKCNNIKNLCKIYNEVFE